MKQLNCGCADDGRPVYTCMACSHSQCDVHRGLPHLCPECPGCHVRHGYPLHDWRDGRLVQQEVAAR